VGVDCTTKEWQIITGLPTDPLTPGDTFEVDVPLELEVDGEGVSWSLDTACGIGEVFLSDEPEFVTLDSEGILVIAPTSCA